VGADPADGENRKNHTPVGPVMAGTPQATPEAGPGRPYRLHFFVCTSGPDCPEDGPAQEIRTQLKQEVKKQGLSHEVRVNHSGCLGQCGHGPIMVVYPEGAWYAHLDVAKATQILQAHLEDRMEDVARLRYRLGPGGVTAPRDETGRRACPGGCQGPAAKNETR
jgi:(2Fe-2S) ferredoxin